MKLSFLKRKCLNCEYMNTLMIVIIIVMIVGVVLILIPMCLCVEYYSTWKHHSKYTVYQEIFVSLNFPENVNFNNFTKSIFANDPRG